MSELLILTRLPPNANSIKVMSDLRMLIRLRSGIFSAVAGSVRRSLNKYMYYSAP